jgi:hypothetical protein
MGAVGHHLALEFDGADLAAALAHAVEAWSEAVADVHPSLVADHHAVELTGSTPSALLLAVLEECLRRGREGQVAVGLQVEVGADGCVRGEVATVPAGDAHVTEPLPHVLSWHEVSLERHGDAWQGRVSAR